MDSSSDITGLLLELREGASDADEQLYDHVYGALKNIAQRHLRKGRPGETMNTTALVHEAYLKLVDQTQAQWADRAHFFSVASIAMRQIVLNYVRSKNAQKRGGGWSRIDFDEEQLNPHERAHVLIALDESLRVLSNYNEHLGRIVEMRFFGGMTEKEIGNVLGVSERTIARNWVKAKAFLSNSLSSGS